MPPTGFEPAIPASERPQTHALDRAATGISSLNNTSTNTNNTKYWIKNTTRNGATNSQGKSKGKDKILHATYEGVEL